MSYKRTLIFFLIFTIVGGFYFLYEVKGGPKRKEAEERAKTLIDVKQENITSVTIERMGEAVVLEKENDAWNIARPVNSPTEQGKAEQLVKALADLKYERDLGEQAELKPFGLAEPEIAITIGNRNAEKILLGSTTPDGANFYVKKENAGNIYTAAVSVRNQLNQDLFALRDKRLLDFAPPDVTAITLERDGRSLSLKKHEEEWRIVSPLEREADADKVSDLLDTLKYARIEAFIEENAPELQPYGLKEPAARMELRINDKLEAVALAKTESAPKKVYAVTGDSRRVVQLDDTLMEKISAAPDEWRDKRLVKLEPDTIDKIEIQLPAARLVLRQDEKNSSDWLMLEPQQAPADAERVDSLLRALARAKAVKFLEEGKETSRLLENPRIRLSLWKKNEEQPVLLVFAQRSGEKEWIATMQSGDVALVDSSLAEEISVEPASFLDKSVARFDALDIEKVEFVRNDKTYAIAREDVEWDIPRSLKIESYEIDQVLWDLREMKYSRALSDDERAPLDLPSPLLRVRLWEGQDAKPLSFAFHEAQEEDFFYVVSEDGGRVMEVEGEFLKELLQKL